jgi:hypothetical protein
MKLRKREDENSLWKRLRTYRKAEYELDIRSVLIYEIRLWSFGVPILAGAYRSSRVRA